ncbi:MAG: tetratricopeptide repeat protein, partial [Saprospiraceae bacterium]
MRTGSVFCLLAILSVFVSNCSEHDTPAVNSTAKPSVVMNDSIWRADSVRMWVLWEQYWFYDDNNRYDSAIAICKQMIDAGKPMMEFRYDSTIYEKYAKAYGGIGYNLIEKGMLDEGISQTNKAIELITNRFGENHVRNTELCSAATVYYTRKGDYEQALHYCDKSLEIRKKVFKSNHYYVGNILNNYALVYEEKGDYDKAIEYFYKSIGNYKTTAPVAIP